MKKLTMKQELNELRIRVERLEMELAGFLPVTVLLKLQDQHIHPVTLLAKATGEIKLIMP